MAAFLAALCIVVAALWFKSYTPGVFPVIGKDVPVTAGFDFKSEWYLGGTLQAGTVADWNAALPENQLASMGGFVALGLGIGDLSVVRDPADMAKVRQQAKELQDCIGRMASQAGMDPERKITDLVALCLAELIKQSP